MPSTTPEPTRAFDTVTRPASPLVSTGASNVCSHHLCRLLLLALVLGAGLISRGSSAAQSPAAQYLLFQNFLGGPDPGGIFHRAVSKDQMLQVARQIVETVGLARTDPDRILGFSIGPVAMDEGENEVRSVIRDAFDVALTTGMAVALHLDDYMMWEHARWPDGRLLRAAPDAVEWKDWPGTPAGGLEIGWLQNVRLPPQMCYESPAARDFATYWTENVVGQEVKMQVDRLAQSGKAKLFAGVIVGWESNLAHGYCSLSHLGYSAQSPPADFDHERERVLQRHIERWAKGIYDAGIPREQIFTHIGPIPKRAYEKLSAMISRSRYREIPQSTAFRAFWTAFNNYSRPGFSGYPEEDAFDDIYQAMRQYGGKRWAMAEGTNVVLGRQAVQPALSWETYLARSFNHDAGIVNLFGGFQGPTAGEFGRSTESDEALAAYRKFLRGEPLVEGPKE